MQAASAGFARVLATRVAGKARRLAHNLFDSYHPELHYMRGPGPKWREKHGHPPAKTHLGEFGLPTVWKAGA
jgi:hypothetical protein